MFQQSSMNGSDVLDPTFTSSQWRYFAPIIQTESKLHVTHLNVLSDGSDVLNYSHVVTEEVYGDELW